VHECPHPIATSFTLHRHCPQSLHQLIPPRLPRINAPRVRDGLRQYMMCVSRDRVGRSVDLLWGRVQCLRAFVGSDVGNADTRRLPVRTHRRARAPSLGKGSSSSGGGRVDLSVDSACCVAARVVLLPLHVHRQQLPGRLPRDVLGVKPPATRQWLGREWVT
jgi:hypothetical protein